MSARTCFSFGAFELDAADRLLRSGGELVPLTPKALDTLLLLVQHQGHVVTKEELLDRLWPDSFVEQNNLAQNVSLLRKTLGERADGGPFIDTVPKRGYRFVAPVTQYERPSSGAMLTAAGGHSSFGYDYVPRSGGAGAAPAGAATGGVATASIAAASVPMPGASAAGVRTAGVAAAGTPEMWPIAEARSGSGAASPTGPGGLAPASPLSPPPISPLSSFALSPSMQSAPAGSSVSPAPPAPAFAMPETRYAQSGDVSVAYQVIGDGPFDLVFVMGWVSHLECIWTEPTFARFLQRLAGFARVILFDKRGTGLSDRVTAMPTLEQRMDDVRAVMEAAGSSQAVLLGVSEGGPMCSLFAATYPEKTLALVMIGTYARRLCAPDYPWGPTPAEHERFYELIQREWGGPVGIAARAPSLAQDAQFRDWWAAYLRMSASPGAALTLTRMNADIDVREVLPSVRVPSLILHRSGDRCLHVEGGRYVASRIPGARFVELPGDDHLPFVGDQEALLAEIETFLGGVRDALDLERDRQLATVLYGAVDPFDGFDAFDAFAPFDPSDTADALVVEAAAAATASTASTADRRHASRASGRSGRSGSSESGASGLSQASASASAPTRISDAGARLLAFATREIERHRGRLVAHTGALDPRESPDRRRPALMASFDGPARAIRCGAAIAEVARRLDLPLRIGAHTGECAMTGGAVRGTAVEIARRIAAQATPPALLVSRTVRDLVAGSGLRFQDCGLFVRPAPEGELPLFCVETRHLASATLSF